MSDGSSEDQPRSNLPASAVPRGEYVSGVRPSAGGQGRLVQIKERSHFSGPLPPPDTLVDYESVLPGSADRIFRRFELQSDHRMLMEAQVIDGNVFSQKTGSIVSGILGWNLAGLPR